MLEVPTPPNPLLTDLVSKIDAASMPIAEFWRERDGGLDAPRRKLSYEEEARLKRLIEPRNQGIKK